MEFSRSFRLIDNLNYPYLDCPTTRPWPLDFIAGGETEERAADRRQDGNRIPAPIHIFRIDQRQAEILARGIDAEAHGRIHGYDGRRYLLRLDNIRAVKLGTKFVLAWKSIGGERLE